MTSKVKQTIVLNEPVSLEDAGYKASVNLDSNHDIALFVMSKDSKFPNEITETTKNALYIGFQRRANERKGTKYYYSFEGNLVPIESLDKAPKGRETVAITVDFAMAQNPYEFGKLKETNPPLYSIIKEVRTYFSKYASDCMSALKSCANKIINENKPKERKPNKNFRESLEHLFNDAKSGLDKKVKTANAKKDLTADPDMYKMAKEAFFKVYTKK